MGTGRYGASPAAPSSEVPADGEGNQDQSEHDREVADVDDFGREWHHHDGKQRALLRDNGR